MTVLCPTFIVWFQIDILIRFYRYLVSFYLFSTPNAISRHAHARKVLRKRRGRTGDARENGVARASRLPPLPPCRGGLQLEANAARFAQMPQMRIAIHRARR